MKRLRLWCVIGIAISVAGCQRPASAEEHAPKEVPEGFVPLFDQSVLPLPNELYFHPRGNRKGDFSKQEDAWMKHMIWPEVLFPAKLLYDDPLMPEVESVYPDRKK